METSISGRRLRLSVFWNYLRRLADKFPAPPVIAIDCPVDVGPRMQQLLEGKETARSSLSHLAILHTLNRLNHTSTHEHPRRHRLQTHYRHWPAHPSWHWELIHHRVLLHRFASWHSWACYGNRPHLPTPPQTARPGFFSETNRISNPPNPHHLSPPPDKCQSWAYG